MIKKEPLIPARVRKIEYPFGWIPHRFITNGYAGGCTREELLMYIFLTTVSDKSGLSFYGDKRICSVLGIDQQVLEDTRRILEAKGLIAYQKPLYQLLSLPGKGGEDGFIKKGDFSYSSTQ